MNFSEALEALKKGEQLQRKGWNGKGMFIFLTSGSHVEKNEIRSQTLKYADETRSKFEKQEFPSSRLICSHIDMMAADGTIVIGWLASQTDMLSEDWEIV